MSRVPPGRRALGLAVKMPTSQLEYLGSVPSFPPDASFLLMQTLVAYCSGDASSDWVAATHVGD